MSRRDRWSRVLGMAGMIVLVLGLVDPLEGFPVVLAGGAILAISARLAMSRWFRLLGWGWAAALVGCGAMVALSARGGFGGTTGLAPVWGLTVVPYPAGALTSLVGGVLLLRERHRLRRAPASTGI
jgi:hypothetical protein